MIEKSIKLDKAIAYFLGWRIDNSFPDKGKVWRSPKGDIELDTTFKFSSDWNKLMEVFDAVNRLEGVSVSITDCDCKIHENGVLFGRAIHSIGTQSSVYTCLGDFIYEYNKFQLENNGA